jgi:uncharacterized repeat protein (TIGR03847 family)
MPDPIEFDPVDLIAIGALGKPGQRVFMIQAVKEGARLCVVLEKQQVALLAAEAEEFLDRVQAEDAEPEPALDPASDALCGQVVEAEPLFRVRLIGIGYDRDRRLVLLELREQADEDNEGHPIDREEVDGHIARVYATRAQVRAMIRHANTSVESGRPACPLCELPMDPDGHFCPRLN